MRARPVLLRRCRFWVGVLAVVTALFPAARARAADAAGGAETVDKLIHQSSAAAQIEASGNPAAKAKHKAAEEIYRRAVQAKDEGQTERETELLREAARTMMAAAQLASPESLVNDRKRADFGKRIASVEVLLAAYDRIRKEKVGGSEGSEIGTRAHETVARAQQAFDADQLDESRALLDEVYASVKTGIERLRGGDRLVRSLSFGSKQEEYRYELDRNDTHHMLINMLKEKMDSPGVTHIVRPLLERATTLRRQAEAAAASGQHESAVTLLEESTAQLVRAIRAAGIYIPS